MRWEDWSPSLHWDEFPTSSIVLLNINERLSSPIFCVYGVCHWCITADRCESFRLNWKIKGYSHSCCMFAYMFLFLPKRWIKMYICGGICISVVRLSVHVAPGWRHYCFVGIICEYRVLLFVCVYCDNVLTCFVVYCSCNNAANRQWVICCLMFQHLNT